MFLEGGRVPLGTLLRREAGGNALPSLLRDAFSAIAAATREAWSLQLDISGAPEGEFRSSEALGSFPIIGSVKLTELAGFLLDDDPNLLLSNMKIKNKGIYKKIDYFKLHTNSRESIVNYKVPLDLII